MISKSEFLKRFLHQARETDPYWITEALEPEVLEKAAAAAKEDIEFEAHRVHFDLLAGIIDKCVQEQVDAAVRKDFGVRSTLKHPQILELGNLPPDQRAGMICAAAQGMRWIDEIQPWVNGHTLQNEIAKRTLVGVLRCLSKKKQSFSGTDLKTVARLGSSIEGQDSFGPVAQAAIVEILAANTASLTIDDEIKTILHPYLDRMSDESDLASIVKAVDKLRLKLENN